MKSSGPVLIGGVGVSVAVGEGVAVGVSGVFVAAGSTGVGAVSSGVSVGGGGGVSCSGEVGEMEGVTVWGGAGHDSDVDLMRPAQLADVEIAVRVLLAPAPKMAPQMLAIPPRTPMTR